MPAADPAPSVPSCHFEQQHQRLDAQLHAHLLHLIGGDFARALAQLEQWRAGLAQHIAIENTRLLPHVPADARWAARVYLVEHERIALLADEHLDRLRAAASRAPLPDGTERRTAILALLDGVHALRHVLEHHHEREHMALARELPLALQAAAWAGVAPQAAAGGA